MRKRDGKRRRTEGLMENRYFFNFQIFAYLAYFALSHLLHTMSLSLIWSKNKYVVLRDVVRDENDSN